jgi:hypothetical protein
MTDAFPSSGSPDPAIHPLAERLAESVIHEFHQELQDEKVRRHSMAKKHVWGTQPLWVFGVGLMLASGLLLRGDDRWIVLVIGALMLAIEVGLWRPIESKRGLLEGVLSAAVALTAIARLAESVNNTFTVNHVYLVLALVGAVFVLVESVRRGTPGADTDR